MQYSIAAKLLSPVPVNAGPGPDDDRRPGRDQGDGLALAPVKPRLKKPGQYQVIMLNDDYTPMEFVVHVLQSFFSMPLEKATHVMLTVHTRGSAVCGTFTRDVAEAKAHQVNSYAREHQHPLLCEIMPLEDEDRED